MNGSAIRIPAASHAPQMRRSHFFTAAQGRGSRALQCRSTFASSLRPCVCGDAVASLKFTPRCGQGACHGRRLADRLRRPGRRRDIAAACALLQVYGLWRSPVPHQGRAARGSRRAGSGSPRRLDPAAAQCRTAAAQAAAVLLARRRRRACCAARSTKPACACRRRFSPGLACALVGGVVTSLYGPVAGLASGLALLTSFEWERAATSARVDMSLAFGPTLAFIGLLHVRRGERPRLAGAVLRRRGVGDVEQGDSRVSPFRRCKSCCSACSTAARGSPCACGRSLGLRPCCSSPAHGTPLPRRQGGGAFLTHRRQRELRARGRRAALHPRTSPFGSAICRGAARRSAAVDRAVAERCARAVARPPQPSTVAIRASSALLWIVAVFAPHAVAASKRGVYLLPLYPAVCLLARLVGGRTSSASRLTASWVARLLGRSRLDARARRAGSWPSSRSRRGSVSVLLDAVARSPPIRARPSISRTWRRWAAAWMRLAAFFALATVAALALSSGGGAGRWDIVADRHADRSRRP